MHGGATGARRDVDDLLVVAIVAAPPSSSPSQPRIHVIAGRPQAIQMEARDALNWRFESAHRRSRSARRVFHRLGKPSGPPSRRALVRVLERPATLLIALAADQGDRFFVRSSGTTSVDRNVETAQHVVIPAGREREHHDPRVDDDRSTTDTAGAIGVLDNGRHHVTFGNPIASTQCKEASVFRSSAAIASEAPSRGTPRGGFVPRSATRRQGTRCLPRPSSHRTT
jgi:hypothetical protein